MIPDESQYQFILYQAMVEVLAPYQPYLLLCVSTEELVHWLIRGLWDLDWFSRIARYGLQGELSDQLVQIVATKLHRNIKVGEHYLDPVPLGQQILFRFSELIKE